MVRYFLAYPSEATEEAVAADRELVKKGLCNTQTEAPSEEEALKAADFLFLLVTDGKQLDTPDMRRMWEFFDNDIRWKRKPHGEILFLVQSEDTLSALPLRLKKYGYYLLSETEDLADYCLEATADAGADEKPPEEREAAPEVKQIRYNPAPPAVKQIEFSVRAPRVESFDGSASSSGPRNSGACRRDHIFAELGHDDGGMRRRTEQKEKKKKTRKAVGFALFGLILGIVLTVVVVVAM